MTVSDKLVAIGRKLTKIFDVGFEKGYDKGHAEGYEEGVSQSDYTQGYEDGKKAEYDAFWDALQQNGTRVKYNLGVCGDNWTKETFKPKYPIRPEGVMSNCFAYWGMNGVGKDIDLREACVLDTSQATNAASCFYNNTAVVGIGILDFTNVTSMPQVFGGATNLVTIEEIILGSGVYNMTDMFKSCNSLTNISFGGEIRLDIDFQWSTKLTEASIRSIITHLSDTASGKTLTLSKVAADNAFPEWIPGDVNVGTELNSAWATLVASKPNWTITLV